MSLINKQMGARELLGLQTTTASAALLLAYGKAATDQPIEKVLTDAALTGGLSIVSMASALALTMKQRVDGALGAGWYDEWRQLEDDSRREQTRSAKNEKRFNKLGDPGATSWLDQDTTTLEGVTSMYRTLLEEVATGKAYDKKRIGIVHDILTLALGAVYHDNEALDLTWNKGIVEAFLLIPFAEMAKRAARLSRAIRILKRELAIAKSKAKGAVWQGVIDTALTAVTLFEPHLSLLTRATIFVGQWILDNALGPSTPTALNVGAKANISVAELASAYSEVQLLGEKVTKFSIATGKVTTVTGFFFDTAEMLVALNKVSNLEKTMAVAKKECDGLIDLLKASEPLITMLKDKCERWLDSIEGFSRQSDFIRDNMKSLMRDAHIRP
jgi:hypothetical protein